MDMKWNRKLWGIAHIGKNGKTVLIGSLWFYDFMRDREYYDQEPTRALLFCTRKAAREWCKAKGYPHLRPVCVTETVRMLCRSN